MAYIWGGLGNGSGPIGGEGLSQLGHRARGVAVRVQKGSVPILCRSGEGCLGRGLGRVGGEGHEGISALGRPGSVSVGCTFYWVGVDFTWPIYGEALGTVRGPSGAKGCRNLGIGLRVEGFWFRV
jgi:hypothetical protein